MSSSPPSRILVIDDEASLRMVFTVALSSEGYVTDSANGPEESLAKMKSLEPDLVIVDLKMPLMNGIEVAKLLRKNGYQHPIVICSAFIATELLQEAFALGIVDFISKPTTPDALRGVAGRILAAKNGNYPSVFEEVRHLIRGCDFAAAKSRCEGHLEERKGDVQMTALHVLLSRHLDGEIDEAQPVDISSILL